MASLAKYQKAMAGHGSPFERGRPMEPAGLATKERSKNMANSPTPPRENTTQPVTSHSPGPFATMFVKAGVLATVTLMAGFAATHFYPDKQDQLTETQRQEILQNMDDMPPVQLQKVQPGERPAALKAMPLSDEALQALESTLQPTNMTTSPPSAIGVKETRLVWMEARDFAAQDGDVIEVSSAGYRVQVHLLNAPTRFSIPVDSSNIVTITGQVDGGGGITLGLSHADHARIILAPGASFQLPILY